MKDFPLSKTRDRNLDKKENIDTIPRGAMDFITVVVKTAFNYVV